MNTVNESPAETAKDSDLKLIPANQRESLGLTIFQSPSNDNSDRRTLRPIDTASFGGNTHSERPNEDKLYDIVENDSTEYA